MFDQAKVLRALHGRNVLYAEIFDEETAYTFIQLESEKVEKLEKGLDKGVGLRMIRPWQTFFASTNSKEEGRLLDLAKDLASQSVPGEGQAEAIELRRAEYPFSIEKAPEGRGHGKEARPSPLNRIGGPAHGKEDQTGEGGL